MQGLIAHGAKGQIDMSEKTPTIIVSGPVQVGKTAVMLRIKQVLEQEFGAQVSIDPNIENFADLIPPEWEKELVRANTWTLIEVTTRG